MTYYTPLINFMCYKIRFYELLKNFNLILQRVREIDRKFKFMNCIITRIL